MECTRCGLKIADAGFPGAHITCSCGADLVVPRPSLPSYASATSPYRSPPLLEASPKAQPPERPCPRCRQELLAVDDGYECEGCSGSLVRHKVLKAELAAAAEEAKGRPRTAHASGVHLEADVRYLSCPDCHESMTRMNFGLRSGVIVDVCQAHGTWFDRGERARVVDFVRMAGLPSARRAAQAPALSPEAAASLGRAEALMQYETLSAETHASHAIDVLDDLVWGLFGD